jgi:hypothetical protein
MITTIPNTDIPMTTTPFYFTHDQIYNANFDGDIILNIFIWIVFALLWIIPLYFVFISAAIKVITKKRM